MEFHQPLLRYEGLFQLFHHFQLYFDILSIPCQDDGFSLQRKWGEAYKDPIQTVPQHKEPIMELRSKLTAHTQLDGQHHVTD